MELSNLGKHCNYCNQLDFLPIYCNECNLAFCSKHFNNHLCKNIVSNNNIKSKKQKNQLIKCKQCKKKFKPLLIKKCNKCSYNFCIKHTNNYHDCNIYQQAKLLKYYNSLNTCLVN